MDPDWVTGSCLRQVCEDRLSERKGGSAYSQRKADPFIFGAKMVPCLWRADPSFRNSVTGSGSRAKCSNILQDTTTVYIFQSMLFFLTKHQKVAKCTLPQFCFFVNVVIYIKRTKLRKKEFFSAFKGLPFKELLCLHF